MSKRVIDLRSQAPLLDIVSYARGRGPLSPSQHAYIARTVRRVPEVMVKVSGGARTLAGVERHMKYIEKKGPSGLETDMETRSGGQGFARDLVIDWDLDIEALKHYSTKTFRDRPPKLVHNIIFSMPAGTPPKKVLDAVRKLALNEWALQHRYAMALHTDTPRPHVHVVVKAMSEQGSRLNIKKATLRDWRARFAENLRELGVEANATERAVRGETRTHKRTPIYRAAQRGASTHMRERRDEASHRAATHIRTLNAGHIVMNRTRQYVVAGWEALTAQLRGNGEEKLAEELHEFKARMRPVQTEIETLAQAERNVARQGRAAADEHTH